MPIITFSGVRNSWLMPCRNSGTDWSCVKASCGIGVVTSEGSFVGFTVSFSKRLEPVVGPRLLRDLLGNLYLINSCAQRDMLTFSKDQS
jgi:hypothetical protein